MSKPKRMTPATLERWIRTGMKRHGLRLSTVDGYVDEKGTCCAIGGALAYAAKTPEELRSISAGLCGELGEPAPAAARLLNHGATEEDMINLEAGFEGWRCRWSAGVEVGFSGPFYELGKKLRAEADGKASK